MLPIFRHSLLVKNQDDLAVEAFKITSQPCHLLVICQASLSLTATPDNEDQDQLDSLEIQYITCPPPWMPRTSWWHSPLRGHCLLSLANYGLYFFHGHYRPALCQWHSPCTGHQGNGTRITSSQLWCLWMTLLSPLQILVTAQLGLPLLYGATHSVDPPICISALPPCCLAEWHTCFQADCLPVRSDCGIPCTECTQLSPKRPAPVLHIFCSRHDATCLASPCQKMQLTCGHVTIELSCNSCLITTCFAEIKNFLASGISPCILHRSIDYDLINIRIDISSLHHPIMWWLSFWFHKYLWATLWHGNDSEDNDWSYKKTCFKLTFRHTSY